MAQKILIYFSSKCNMLLAWRRLNGLGIDCMDLLGIEKQTINDYGETGMSLFSDDIMRKVFERHISV